MNYDPTNPLIVQGDRSVLVEVDNPRYAEARDALAPFAELEKSPEHIHTYRLTPLSLWNAAAAGMTRRGHDRRPAPLQQVPAAANLAADIAELVSRYGRVKLERAPTARTGCACSPRLPGPAAAGRAGPAAEGARLPGRAARRRPASASTRPIAACSSRR